ncbi:hypothetical protein HPT29_019480 [Microvirga terrae]|uniref:Uncharacterized protein n=1 Tax=Microvirga terrae TaxID=2740529 RepID=A0ABY5RQR3_9HYPH|nr:MULTISPECIES: hypothetical protein [Microvirga]MBQ0822819.1 hypothetical protein [Microvirga sp. HBU67558]UVF18649.1 hypothetical protein HPT29_019480 [Microvirga terrae]
MTPSHVMAGLVPAISIRKSAAPHTIGITGTNPVLPVSGTADRNEIDMGRIWLVVQHRAVCGIEDQAD